MQEVKTMKLLSLLLFFGVLRAPVSALAEGGSCPPGFYPIGGQGARGCAPIPGGDSGGSDQLPLLPPTPTGEWLSTWGAIAASEATSEVGMASGMNSAEAAAAEAVRRCGGGGATDCKVTVSYSNQCVAWLIPSSGGSGAKSAVGKAPKKRQAISLAGKGCVDPSGKKCRVFYADCSEPVFRKF